jgi:hypothetical protein
VAGEIEDGVEVGEIRADDQSRGGETRRSAEARAGEIRADEGVGQWVHSLFRRVLYP